MFSKVTTVLWLVCQKFISAPPPESIVQFKAEDGINDGLEYDDSQTKESFITPSSTKVASTEKESSAPQQQNENIEEDDNTKLGREIFKTASNILNSSTLHKAKAWSQMNKAAELGNTDALVRIAFAKLLGNDYFGQDLKAAKSIFEKATNEKGHPEAQMGLGFLYATGTMSNSSQATALLYYTFAAFGGN